MKNLNEIKNGKFLVHSNYGSQNYVENKIFNTFEEACSVREAFEEDVALEGLEHDGYYSEIYEIKDVEALKNWIEEQSYHYELNIQAVIACGETGANNHIVEQH